MGDVDQRGSAPLRERLDECVKGALRVGSQCPLADLERALEAPQVESVTRHEQRIAGRTRHQHVIAAGLQELPKLGHAHTQRGRARGRLVRAPQLLHQPVARHDTTGVEQQQRQQLTLAGARHRDGAPVMGDLQRSEDAEVHGGATLPAAVTPTLRTRNARRRGCDP